MSQGYGEYHQKLLATTADRMEKIKRIVEENPTWNYIQIGEQLGVSRAVVSKLLKRMSEK